MPHEFFPHTGDIGVRVWADSVEGLFEAAVAAFTDAITDIDAVQAREQRELSCRAPALDLLLHDLLSEVLFQLDARRLLARSASAAVTREGDLWRVDARVEGEPIDPARHPVKVLVKAVTYHGLELQHTAGGWTATVIFDV